MLNDDQQKRLRFAPLIRVSTEKQKKQGESLRTQRKHLDEAIKSLGGVIVHWYAGQEHATPEQERKILEEFIEDVKTNRFDAVMIDDLGRWSRDNYRSKSDLKILRNKEIRFFVRTQEYDLNDPLQSFLIGVGVEVEEFFARQQAYKSQINRIERAKRRIPTSGKLPYGRIFNKETGTWKVIPKDKRKMEAVAREFLEENVDFNTLGKKFGMNGSNLHKILTKRCGDSWTIRFKSPIQNKDRPYEEITIKGIPRLLPEETIRRIRQKCEARRTWTHGFQKYQYLFSRKIFDVDTGYALTGTTNKRGQRYYRPYKGKGYQYSINADVIEKAILEALFEALSNRETLRKAVFEGNPMSKIADEMGREISLREKALRSVNAKLSDRAKKVAHFSGNNLGGFLNKVKKEIEPMEERKVILEAEIKSLKTQQETLPTEEEIEGLSKMAKALVKKIERSHFESGHTLNNLSFEEKRKLVNLIFGGRDSSGRKYGIYIKFKGGKPKRYSFEAYGKIGVVSGSLESRSGKSFSIADTEMEGLKDQQAPEVIKEISKVIKESESKRSVAEENTKAYMLSKCDAYHCFCFYQ